MSVKKLAVIFLLLAAGMLSGCRAEYDGFIEREQVFTPVSGFTGSSLEIRLNQFDQAGVFKAVFLDFAGKRVQVVTVSYQAHDWNWGWDLGRGATINGDRFYAIKIVPVVSAGPLPFRYYPIKPDNRPRVGWFTP